MPHCVVEYSRDIEENNDIKALISALHGGMNDSGLFNTPAIKTRAHPYDHYVTGDETKPFVHTTVFLLDGRTDEQKKTLAMNLLEIKQGLLSSVPNLSVDVRDMNRAAYSK